MFKTRVITIVFGLALVAGVPTATVDAQPGSKGDGELVSETDLEERGPYRFAVEGVGEFEIRKVAPRQRLDEPCSVHVASLEESISNRHRSGRLDLEPGGTTNITLALSECVSDTGKTVPCCKGKGELCAVNVAALKLY